MKFIILRLLTHSELGMFHEYRRQGKERGKQRAINFDSDVVDMIFPSATDSDQIDIECRRLEDENTVVEVSSWLRRQHKNWRFEGDCPTGSYYHFVDPGVLFAMVVDAAITPAKASWVVVPTGHPAYSAIMNHGESARLSQSAMVALYGEHGAHCRAILAENFGQLFEGVEHMESKSGLAAGSAEDNGEVPPDPLGLFRILARAGHSLPSAVADLVDNSISHKAKTIDITFPNPNESGRWMCIRDDGEGMTPEGLRDAMRIGHQRDYDDADLGKYGYGLKGAAWSQADRLTVVSKSAGHKQSVLTWDKDHLARTRRWELLNDEVQPPHAKAVEIGDAGTAVLLTQMRPTIEPAKRKGVSPYALELAGIRDHLELVFHRFLEGKVPGREKVVIRVNGEPLRPNNPIGHPLTRIFDERRIELHGQEGGKVILSVRPAITPNEAEFEEYIQPLSPEDRRVERDRLTLNGRANDAQGFYFYRLHRLIKWGGWEGLFAKDEHTKLLRVAVDFDRAADEQLQVDISKQLIRLPVAVSDHLKEILRSPRVEARSRYDKKAPSAKTSASPSAGKTPATSTGTGTNHKASSDGADGGDKPFTTGAPVAPSKKDKAAIRLVSAGSSAWERKIGFSGEHVEITPKVPQLVALAQAVDKDSDAKHALSEFLRVLETAGVPKLLTGQA